MGRNESIITLKTKFKRTIYITFNRNIMKKAIGILVMLIGLTANAQSLDALVDTLQDGSLSIELDNTLYIVDVKSNNLSLYNVTDDRMGAMLSKRYKLSEVVIPKNNPCPNLKN